jgi:hypothetical protein
METQKTLQHGMMTKRKIMKLRIINFLVFIFFVTTVMLFVNVSFANAVAWVPVSGVHSMSPREGYVKTSTGAPVADATVIEYTDNCPSDYVWNIVAPGCTKPTGNCYAQRSVKTDANGYYYFRPWWPGNRGYGTNACQLDIWWNFTCSNPRVFLKVDVGNLQASRNLIIEQAHAADTTDCPPVQHSTNNISDNIETDLTCSNPPACGKACASPSDCQAAKDGCTACISGTCKAAACGTTCTKDSECGGAKDGCTACVPNGDGKTSSCKTPPACGVSCTKDADCTGAKERCTRCNEGKCSQFSQDACKCDGMSWAVKGVEGAKFFPGDKVTFIAFSKVEGFDINIADVESMTLSLYQSKLSDPNNATRIAQSAAITPVKVESTGDKERYKVTWDQQIPTTVPAGTLFRMQAAIKCKVNTNKVLGAKTTADQIGNYFTTLYDSVSAMFIRGNVLGDAITPTPVLPRQNQHADFFEPGSKIIEKSCTLIKFIFE